MTVLYSALYSDLIMNAHHCLEPYLCMLKEVGERGNFVLGGVEWGGGVYDDK